MDITRFYVGIFNRYMDIKKQMNELTGKCEMIIVPVPKNADDFHIIHESTRVAYFSPEYKRFDIPKQEYEIIGKLSTLTEEQFDKLVDWMFWDETPERKRYKNYHKPIAVTYPFLSAKESFISLLKSEGIKIKERTDEPKMNHWGASMEDYIQFTSDKEEYDKTPEDFLILKINE